MRDEIEYNGLIETEGFIQLLVLNGDEIEYRDLIETEGFIQLQVINGTKLNTVTS